MAPVSKRELALLLTAMLASVSVCCGLLNLFLPTDRTWSLYVIGAALMLWLWLVPPLLLRGMPLVLRLAVDAAAVGVYVFLIAVDLNGMDGTGRWPSPSSCGAERACSSWDWCWAAGGAPS